MAHHLSEDFDHRFGTYEGQTEAQANQGKLPELTERQHADPTLRVLPRYWVPEKEVLVRAARMPEALAEAYASGREDAARQFLAFWLAGYHLNRGDAKFGKDVLFRLFGSVFKSTTEAVWDLTIASDKAPALDREYPLSEDDLRLIRESPDAVTAVRRLVEARCPEWLLGWRNVCAPPTSALSSLACFRELASGTPCRSCSPAPCRLPA